MVASLQSVRMLSSQMLLKALKDADAEKAGTNEQSSSPGSQLLQRYGYDTSSSSSNTTLQRLLDSFKANPVDAAEDAASTPATVSPDITTASFMAGLKAKLVAATKAPGGSPQAEAMLKALEAGTLTVTDATGGKTITAWDVDAEAEKDTESKPGTATETIGWSDFLKAHLTRGATATFARADDNSYIDKTNGHNADFGTVGSTYVYMSWPTAKPATPATPAAPATPAGGTTA